MAVSGNAGPDGGAHSFRARFASMADGLKGLASARLALFRLEAKEAAALGGKAAALIAVALFLLLPAHLLVCATLYLLLAGPAGLHPAAACGILAALHLAAIAGLALVARKLLAQPMFPATAEEFEKDKSWIRTIRTQRPTPKTP